MEKIKSSTMFDAISKPLILITSRGGWKILDPKSEFWTEHNTTDFGSRILHRDNKPDSLTEIPSIQNQNKRKYYEFPFPTASPTFPNNVDKKNISHSPKNTTPSNAKRSSSNRCPNQPNKITEYFMRYKQ